MNMQALGSLAWSMARCRSWPIPALGNWGDAVSVIVLGASHKAWLSVDPKESELAWITGLAERLLRSGTTDQGCQPAWVPDVTEDHRVSRVLTAWIEGDKLTPSDGEFLDLVLGLAAVKPSDIYGR